MPTSSRMLRRAVTSIIILLCMTVISFGDSIFSVNGLGQIVYPVDGHARGMGGVNIAYLDGRGASFVNPAIIGMVDTTTVTAIFSFEQRKIKDTISSTGIYSWGPKFVRLIVPISNGVVVGGGIAPYTDVNFHLSSDSEVFGEPYTLLVSADGGIHLGSVTVAKNIGDRLYIGAGANFVFGSMTEEWRRDFVNPEFTGSDDLYDTHYFGQVYVGGIALRPHRRWAIGAVFRRSGTIDATTERSSSHGTSGEEKHELDFPDEYGFGITYRPVSRFIIGADVYSRLWETFRLNGVEVPEYGNTMRFSFGCEVAPATEKLAPFYQKAPWRIGFYREPWYYKDATGNRPSETFFTLGTSIFFKERRGVVDIALEIGRRGDVAENGAQEWVFRQSLSIVGWERWFQKKEY